jgi:hypothetical protein
MIRQDEIEHLFDDPVKNHERIMEMTRPPPVIVHKEYTGRQPSLADGDDQPLSTDDMIEALAQALAETRIQLRDEFQSMVNEAVGPLTEQVAVLQGQVNVLLSLIGSIVGNNNNSSVKEASETKIKTVRRVRQIESKP